MDIRQMYARMDVTTRSPDGNIRGALRGGKRFTFELRPRCIQDYAEHVLESQASQVITELCRAVQTGSKQILEKHGVDTIEPEHLWDANRRRYHAEVAEIECVGMSSGKNIRVTAVGVTASVRIRPGALRAMTEEHFAAELASAAVMMRHDRRQKMLDLKEKYFQLRSGRSVRPAHLVKNLS